MSPELSLAIQYGTEAAQLPRWRLRRWVERALVHAFAARERTHLPTHGQQVSLTLRLVDEAEGRALNHTYRGRDAPTNVLTFEYGADPEGCIHGDIILCLPILVHEAKAQHKPLLHHAAHLVSHGVLHALGYDHIDPNEASVMESLETAILASQKIPDPYTPFIMPH
ncbi:rRNA maturation RNase YbeY [Alcaligenaceae bacterium CGII-47]|nr:rRNA maturation RNase YbeY [Alcaligenaceae bacterium CGII-47]